MIMVRQSADGMLRARCVSKLPSSFLGSSRFQKIFRAIVRLEGGAMTSLTLRKVLADKSGIVVGAHSYGSLLDEGMSDRHTEIGAYCSIGKNVRRYGAAHPTRSASTHPYFYNPLLGFAAAADDVERSSIRIGSDVWIGSNVTILPGCSQIGFGAVIGAGSVVTRDIPDFAIAVGNPARVISFRHSEQKRRDILDSRFWEMSPSDAYQIIRGLDLGLSR